jgi:hypothetical protein
MRKLLTATLLCVTLVSFGQAKNNLDKDKDRINNVCYKIMQQFVAGKLDEAMETLKQNTVMPPNSIDTLKVTVADQFSNVFPQFGEMLSFEFVKEKKVKNFIAKRYYVIRFTKFFLKADFTLYNNGTDWTITAFHYNEEADDLLE